MRCPKCGSNKSFIVNTIEKNDFVSRRRECKKCHNKYTTKELPSDEWIYRVLYKNLVKDLSKLVTKAKSKHK